MRKTQYPAEASTCHRIGVLGAESVARHQQNGEDGPVWRRRSMAARIVPLTMTNAAQRCQCRLRRYLTGYSLVESRLCWDNDQMQRPRPPYRVGVIE